MGRNIYILSGSCELMGNVLTNQWDAVSSYVWKPFAKQRGHQYDEYDVVRIKV